MSDHRLQLEIHEQPAVLRGMLQRANGAIEALADAIRATRIEHVLVAARGTSDHAATYAKYLFGMVNGLPVGLAAPSMYTLYDAPPTLRNTLVLGISQSGMSPDIVAVVENGRAQGMVTAALTNASASPLAQAAEHVIPLGAGEERSVAATKTYTAELMALAMLSAALADDEGPRRELAQVPEAVAGALSLEPTLAQRAERYRYMEQCAVISRGYNYATALEIALKLKELTYTDTTPYSSADFLHGPIAVVRPGYPVLIIAPTGRAQPALRELVDELAGRGAELLIISDDPALTARAELPLRLPMALPEWLSPIPAVVPGQLLGYHLALARGLDPDRPRGLSKVTETH
jgi:glutamine---fructose-6-phosphate transaminase (isomerizing)